MNFIVREVLTDSVVVDFADGSWAQVPYKEEMGGDKAQLVAAIMEYAPKPVVSWVSQVPLEAGETVDGAEVLRVTEPEPNQGPLLNYKTMRERLYPAAGDQLDAYYWANQGQPEPLARINEEIAEIKRLIPKDIAPMTEYAFGLFLEDLA